MQCSFPLKDQKENKNHGNKSGKMFWIEIETVTCQLERKLQEKEEMLFFKKTEGDNNKCDYRHIRYILLP